MSGVEEEEEDVQVALIRDIEILQQLLERMRRVIAQLPVSSRREDEDLAEGAEDLDDTADLRGRLQCVLTDFPAGCALRMGWLRLRQAALAPFTGAAEGEVR